MLSSCQYTRIKAINKVRRIDKPLLDDTEHVFLTCISKIKDSYLKDRLTACKNLIIEATIEFDNKVTKGELHLIERETIVNENVLATELQDVYTNRMAKIGAPGRKIYDKLMSAPAHGICPLCSQRVVKTIDHYLPKASYPKLSVSLINLIPCCSDCNRSKSSSYPSLPEEAILHPYYDDIEKDVWLKANVMHTTPVSIKYEVNAPSSWSKLLTKRVVNHFKSLQLDKLYATQAAVELTNIKFGLNFIYNSSGEVGLQKYLLDGADSRSHANKNSWQAALYRALASDNWFCSGGFKFYNFN